MAFIYQPSFFNEVCRRYATVIKSLPIFVPKELSLFLKWANKSSCWSLVKDPSLSGQWKKQIFDVFYASHPCHEITRNALAVMAHYRRLSFLPQILHFLEETKHTDYQTIYLTTSKRLSGKALLQLSEAFQRFLKKKVLIKQEENKDLLLGCVFLWENFMLDISLNACFHKLKSEMLYAVNAHA